MKLRIVKRGDEKYLVQKSNDGKNFITIEPGLNDVGGVVEDIMENCFSNLKDAEAFLKKSVDFFKIEESKKQLTVLHEVNI